MSTNSTICVAFQILIVIFSQVSNAQQLDYSDLAQIDDNHYLVVNDRKNPRDKGFRLGVLEIGKDGLPDFVPVPVSDWKDRDGAPSDLEACCKIPSRGNEFLLAESGKYDGRFGRVFHVSLKYDDEGRPELEVLGVMEFFGHVLNDEQNSYEGNNVAGMVAFEAFGKTVLAYGERGGETSTGTAVGTIHWGYIDFSNHTFQRIGSSKLTRTSVLGKANQEATTSLRDCSALHLMARTNEGIPVLSVASKDPGDDGPFNSVLYQAGHFRLNKNKKPMVSFHRANRPIRLAQFSGLKVEGVAKSGAGPNLAVVSDDEILGSVWRTIEIQD